MLDYKVFECVNESDEHIILLHGFGGNYRIWNSQIPILRQNFNVVAINLPSHDQNNIKLSQMITTTEEISNKILEVMNELNLKNAIFMGVSIGTLFIKYLELYHADKVKYGILVGSVGYLNSFLKIAINTLYRIGDKLPSDKIYHIFSRIIMPKKCSDKSRRMFRMFAKVLSVNEFRAWLIIFIESSKLNKMFMQECRNKNLYISGESDVCFLHNIKKEAKKIDADFILIEDCGHVCNIDQTEVFNNLLSDYLTCNFV